MRFSMIGSVAIVALATGVAGAGQRWPVFFTGNVNIDPDARTAYGWVSGARNTPDPSERIECSVYGSVGYRAASCIFIDSEDRSGACFSSDPDLINAIQFFQSDSYLAVAWDKDGHCNTVTVYSDSAYIPKVP